MSTFAGSKAPWLIPLVLTSAIACGGSDDAGSSNPASKNEGTTNEGTIAAGTYALETEIDLTKVTGVSSKLDEALAPLGGLSDNPATAILGDKLKDMIPDALEGKIGEWFNAEALAGKVDIVALLAKVKDMLAKFKLLSTLDVASGGDATHTLNGLSADFGGERIDIDLSGVSESVSLGNGTIGGHQFALPLPGGLDKDSLIKKALTAAIGKAIDCDKISTNVSKKCFATVCVGHQEELEGICKKGVEGVASLTLLAMDKLKIDPLKIVAGNIDVLGGGLLGGLWKGTADLGGGPLDIVSKFTGKKTEK